MKKIALVAAILSSQTAACTVRSERTVVERAAQPATAVVVPDARPPSSTTYVVRNSCWVE